MKESVLHLILFAWFFLGALPFSFSVVWCYSCVHLRMFGAVVMVFSAGLGAVIVKIK